MGQGQIILRLDRVMADLKMSLNRRPHLAKFVILVRLMGVEPTRREAQEPKSCMSANSITTAYPGTPGIDHLTSA